MMTFISSLSPIYARGPDMFHLPNLRETGTGNVMNAPLCLMIGSRGVRSSVCADRLRLW